MNWINNVVRPKITNVFKKRDTPDNLWHKCSNCGDMIFHRDFAANLKICSSCNHHARLDTDARLGQLFDNNQYTVFDIRQVQHDPLKFRDQRKYPDRLKENRAKTGKPDAVTVAHGPLDGTEVIVAVQDFAFMGGSLGMAAGEAIVRGAEEALARRCPYILIAASGGARMQEGILSLMQMPRATVAVQLLREAGLPFLVVLTDPTTGGVMASYAMLGDVHIAEPGALIGFSGPRVIEQTIREKLPEGFQRAEFLLEHGMVDMVVHRHQLKEKLSKLVRVLMHRPGTDGSMTSLPLPVVSDEDAGTPPAVI